VENDLDLLAALTDEEVFSDMSSSDASSSPLREEPLQWSGGCAFNPFEELLRDEVSSSLLPASRCVDHHAESYPGLIDDDDDGFFEELAQLLDDGSPFDFE